MARVRVIVVMHARVIVMPIVAHALKGALVIATIGLAVSATVPSAKTVVLVWGMLLSVLSAMPWSMLSRR